MFVSRSLLYPAVPIQGPPRGSSILKRKPLLLSIAGLLSSVGLPQSQWKQSMGGVPDHLAQRVGIRAGGKELVKNGQNRKGRVWMLSLGKYKPRQWLREVKDKDPGIVAYVCSVRG